MTALEAEIEKVNRKLHRTLQPGLQYDGLIAKHLKLEVDFEKNQQYSDTYDTLEYMAQWVGKYADQVKNLAPVLKGQTLGETVTNIYRFLHDHFQYNLDGGLQNLFAPSAAWYYRTTGFDCKSFSILASCILKNLSIDHAFRMVAMADSDYTRLDKIPDFSHVYVIIPQDNKYYVIDATRHENEEVGFIRKQDRPMKVLKHRGLASPLLMGLGNIESPTLLGLGYETFAQTENPILIGLGCPCQGEPLAKNGLGNPAVRSAAIANFHQYLNNLERQGVSRQITDAILSEVRSNIAKGVDPNMSEVIARAAGRRYGLAGALADTQNAVAGAIHGDAGSIMNLAQTLMPKNLISNTFGAVFANGFNLSCWGASLTPQKAGELMKTYHTPYFTYLTTKMNEAVSGAELEKWINQYLKDVYALHAFYTKYKPIDADWSSCALKGIAEYVKFMNALKTKGDQLVSEMTAKGATVRTEHFQPLKFTFPKSMTGASGDKVEMVGGRPESFVDYPQLNLNTAQINSFSQPQQTQTTASPVISTTANADGTKTIVKADGTVAIVDAAGQPVGGSPNPTPAKKGVSTGAIVAATAIAGLLWKILA
jgi:hypothetical protein